MDPRSDPDTGLGDEVADVVSDTSEKGNSTGEDGQTQADRALNRKRSTLETAILMSTLCVSPAV